MLTRVEGLFVRVVIRDKVSSSSTSLIDALPLHLWTLLQLIYRDLDHGFLIPSLPCVWSLVFVTCGIHQPRPFPRSSGGSRTSRPAFTENGAVCGVRDPSTSRILGGYHPWCARGILSCLQALQPDSVVLLISVSEFSELVETRREAFYRYEIFLKLFKTIVDRQVPVDLHSPVCSTVFWTLYGLMS